MFIPVDTLQLLLIMTTVTGASIRSADIRLRLKTRAGVLFRYILSTRKRKDSILIVPELLFLLV